MKNVTSFATGLACGALAYALVSNALFDPGGQSPRPDASADARAEAEGRGGPPSAGVDLRGSDAGGDGGDRRRPNETATDPVRARGSPGGEAEPPNSLAPGAAPGAEPDAAAAEESTLEDALDDLQSGWLAERYTDLLTEAKDERWAYHMEEAILQFLSRHPEMTKFRLDYIECRTTRCQIRVAGYDESTGPDWSRVLYDMKQQVWYEFGPVGTSSSMIEGLRVITTDMRGAAREGA